MYSDEDVKVVAKHFVVHPQLATDAALASCAANEQGKFAAFEHELWPHVWDLEAPRKRLKK
jgi:hypothetical protein